MKYLRDYALYSLIVIVGALLIKHADDAASYYQLAAEMQDLHGATRLAWKSFLENLSFSLFDGATEIKTAYAEVTRTADNHAATAFQLAVGFILLCACQLAVAVGFTAERYRSVAFQLNLIGAVSLVIGVLTPLLTVVAYTSVPVLGEVILRHETKSILDTIISLWHEGSVLLAVLISTFSVVFPLFKIGLLIVVLQPAWGHLHHRATTLLHVMGKWSMADVFVIAVLVAFLAIDKDIHSEARIGLGLYFFAAYCLLSMIAAHLAARSSSSENHVSGNPS